MGHIAIPSIVETAKSTTKPVLSRWQTFVLVGNVNGQRIDAFIELEIPEIVLRIVDKLIVTGYHRGAQRSAYEIREFRPTNDRVDGHEGDGGSHVAFGSWTDHAVDTFVEHGRVEHVLFARFHLDHVYVGIGAHANAIRLTAVRTDTYGSATTVVGRGHADVATDDVQLGYVVDTAAVQQRL